tara:strand:- start:376 stop:609 length:234 start_codon:yes stop_codon:yes gene_type:complete
MDLNKKINDLEEKVSNMQKKITSLENLLLINDTNNFSSNNFSTNNFENNIEVNIDEEVYRSMPPIVRMNAFNKSETI